MSEQQQPLLSTASHEPVKLMGLGRLASARQTVRHHVRRNRTLIVTIQLLTLSLYVVGMFAAHKHAHDVQPVEEGHGKSRIWKAHGPTSTDGRFGLATASTPLLSTLASSVIVRPGEEDYTEWPCLRASQKPARRLHGRLLRRDVCSRVSEDPVAHHAR